MKLKRLMWVLSIVFFLCSSRDVWASRLTFHVSWQYSHLVATWISERPACLYLKHPAQPAKIIPESCNQTTYTFANNNADYYYIPAMHSTVFLVANDGREDILARLDVPPQAIVYLPVMVHTAPLSGETP